MIYPLPPRLILASGSPRRKDLLEEAGFSIEVMRPEVEELEDPAIPIRELTAINAQLKGADIAAQHPKAIVISADTLVLLGDQVFGKPVDREEAESMLAQLSGRTHHVFTAVCIQCRDREIVDSFAVATAVKFRELSLDQQREYHQLIDPMDKAGAYAAQDEGHRIIEAMEGSRTNVIGLPMKEVKESLSERFAYPFL